MVLLKQIIFFLLHLALFTYQNLQICLPELQGRLPIRVELDSLNKEDFRLILTETQNSLIKQYIGLLGTEKVELEFDDDGIEKIATLSTEINQNVENIGARRLHTVMEKLLKK